MAVNKKRRSRAYEIMKASPQERMHLNDGSEKNRRTTAYAIMNQNTRDQKAAEQERLKALAQQRAEREQKKQKNLNDFSNLAYRAANAGAKTVVYKNFNDKLSEMAMENAYNSEYLDSESSNSSNPMQTNSHNSFARTNDFFKSPYYLEGEYKAKQDLKNLGIDENSEAAKQVTKIYGNNAIVKSHRMQDLMNMSEDELKGFTPNSKEEAEAYLQRVQEINKEYAIAQSKGTVDENGMPKRVNESNVDIGGKDTELTMMSIENAYKYGVELDDGQIKAYEDLKERQENEKFSISSSKNLMKEALDTDYDNYTESFKEKSVGEKLDDAFADVNSAIGGLGESAWSAITSFAGSVAKPLYEALNFITVDTFGTGKFAEWAEDVSNYEEKTHNDALEANKEVFSDEAAEYVTMFEEAAAQAIPNVAMAILTGGASGAVTSESLMANATRNISGSTLKNTALTVVEGIKQYMKNPMFTTTFISEAGEAYDDAIENGSDKATALYNAFTVGLLNGLIEMGGGLETGETNFLKDALDEGMEEIWQGSVSNLMAKATYTPDMQWISTDGSDAVFNVKELLLSFLGGVVGGAAGGGIVTGINNAVNPVTTSLQNRVYGDTLKTDTNTLSQYAQIALENGSKRDVNTANEIMLAIQNGTLDEVSSIKVGKFAQNAAKLYQNKYIAAIAQDEAGTSIKERTKSATEIYNTLQNIYTNPEFILNDTRAVMIRRNKVAAESISRSAGLNSTINAQTPVSTVKTIARMVSNGVSVNNGQSVNIDSTGRISNTAAPAQIDVNAAQRIKNGNGSLSDYLSVTGKTLDDYRDSWGEVNADTLRREAHEIIDNNGILADVDNSALSDISNSRRMLNNIQNGSSQSQNGVEIENISGMRSISPQNIVEIKDGDLTLDNGRTVSAENAPFTDDAQALYTASARYKDNAVATAFINGYDGYGGLDVETYAKNFDGVYNVYKAQGGVKLTDEFRDKSTEAFKSRMGTKAYNAAKQAGIKARKSNERNIEGKKKSSQKATENGSRYSLNPYSQKEKDNWKNSKKIIVYENQEMFSDFINNALRDGNYQKTMYFGKINKSLSDKIMASTGINLLNYNITLRADEVRKIIKSHGNESIENKRGQRAITKQDLLNVLEIMNNYDEAIEDKGGYQGLRAINFVKYSPTKTTVFAKIRNKSIDLSIHTMYSSKKNSNLATVADEKSPASTSKTNSSTVTINSIPQNKNTVNGSILEKISKKGVVTESYKKEWTLSAKEKVTESVIKQIANEYAKRGVNVDIVYDENGNNGQWNPKTNTVTVNLAANNPLAAFFHETSHMVKQYSGEYWNDISLMCITYLAETKKTSISELADIKKKLYQTENEEFVNEELVSDAVSLIAQDKQAVRKLYNSLIENNTPKSRIQKILDKFKEVLMRLRTHFIKLGKSFNTNVEAVGMSEISGFSSYVNKLSEGLSTAINELETYGEDEKVKFSVRESEKYTFDTAHNSFTDYKADTKNNLKLRNIEIVDNENQLENIISNALDNRQSKNNYCLGAVSDDLLTKIKGDIGENIFKNGQYSFIISSDDIRHIQEHFKDTKDIKQAIFRLCDTVNNYDTVKLDKQGNRNLLVFEKSYSDYNYLSVELASKKNRSIYLITFYVTLNNKKRVLLNSSAENNTATRGEYNSSNNNISQNDTIVNNSISENGENDTKFSLKENNDNISENSENNTNKFYTIASNSKYAGVGEYNHFSLSVVKRLIKEGQRFRKEYESYTQFAYSNEYDQYSLLEHQFVDIGFDNPDIDANSLTVKKYLRIGEPKVENLTYLNSYNNAEDKREDGVSVITSGWLKSLKSVFFGSSNEKLASRGVYEIEGIDLNFLGGDDEVLIYPVSWAKKTNIKSRKKLEAAVKYLEESQNSEQDTKFSLKEDTTNWKPITPTAETQKVLNRLANNEHVSLDTIRMLKEIREAYAQLGDYEPTANINTPSRQELRQKIQDDVEKLGSARLDENGEWVYDNNIRKEKRIDVVIGLPAAGKSSVLADPLSNVYGSRIVDCDIVKELLPEFNNGYGSDAVHKESKLINDNILDRAMENGENIVLPIVGSGYNKLEQKLQSYKDRGYSVYLHLNELPMNKSLGRMLNRFFETGRFLNPSLPYEYQDKPTKVFNRIIAERGDLIDGYSHYSNDVKRGEKPIFIKGTERVEKAIDAGRNESDRQESLGRPQRRLTETSEAEALIKKYSLMEDVDIKAAQAAIKANQELEKQVKLAGKLFKKAGTVLDYKSVQKISNELLRKYRFSGDTGMRNYITEKLYAFYTYATSEDADDGSAYAYAREIGEDIEKVNGVDIESSEFGEEMSDIIALDISSKYTETAILKSPEEYTKETDRLRESLRQEKAKTNKNDETILKLTRDLKTAVSNFHSAVETKQKYKSEVYELKRKLVQTENKLAKQKQSYEKKIAKLRSNKSKKKANAVEQLRPPQKKFRNLETIQLVAEHGAYEQNEGSSRDIFVPKKDKQGKVISKSVKTVVESDYVSDSAVSAINHAMLEGAMSHEVKTNKSAQKAADRIFERQGYEGAYNEFVSRIELSKEFANNGPDMVALGARLLQEAKERGDDTAAADITANLAVYALLGGRVTQSYNMIKACGATGQALFFERFVKNRNIANEKEWAKKWSVNAKEKYLGKTSEFKPLVLNEELMKKLVVATEQEDIDNISTAIMLDIADQVPSTAGEKIQAWRYFSMLFNPTTHIRNVTGNAVFATVRQGQNVIKTGLEQALNKATKGKVKLTTSIAVGKEYRDFAKSDWKKSQKIAMMSGKFNLENFITQNKKLYKHKIFNATIEKAIKWNSNMLEKEDGIFMKLAYTQALGRYLQVNNISLKENSNAELEAERQRQLAEARANAFMEAETATFRNANAIATALTQLSNQNAAFNLMVNSIMPFKKTPANIFIQSMRYSPIGIGMGIKQIVRDGVKGQKTANEIIDTFASGLTGTGIFLLGMLLRKLGILQGLFGDDDILNDEQGLQENSITICGYTFTIDWSAPMVVPLMMGAEWADSFGDFKIDGKLTDNVWQLVSQSVDPLINMTMLEGVNNILTSIKYSQDNAISDIAIKTGTNFISQFVPTIGGKIAQTVSDSRKRTYIDKDKSETLQTVVQGVQKKTPVWYDKLQPYLDAWGQEDKENVASKILQNFVLPGYLQKVESDTATDLVLEVYEQSGHDKTVVPKTPAKYFTMYELEKVDGKEKSVKGEKINLTGEQYTTLARTQGNMSHALVTALADNSTFNNMDISQKVAVLDNVYDFAKYLGRYAVDNNYSGTSTEKWCRELVNSKKKKTEEQIINTILKRNKE